MKVLFITSRGDDEEKNEFYDDLVSDLRSHFRGVEIVQAQRIIAAKSRWNKHRNSIDLVVLGVCIRKLTRNFRAVFGGPLVGVSTSNALRATLQRDGCDGVSNGRNFITVIEAAMASKQH